MLSHEAWLYLFTFAIIVIDLTVVLSYPRR
jgi:hypothetical protein